MKESIKLLEKKKYVIEKAIQWLKERGVNPHIRINDAEIEFGNCEEEEGLSSFSPATGKVTIVENPDDDNEQTLKGDIAHELFHRADYLDKEGGTRRGRRRIYKEWRDMRELVREVEKDSEYLNITHPIILACKNLQLQGYNQEQSLLKLWRKDPEKFKEKLRIATAIRMLETDNGEKIDKKCREDAALKQIMRNLRKLDAKKIFRMENDLKNFFMQTPVQKNRQRKHCDVLTEFPAYMISKVFSGKTPEEGLSDALKMMKTASEKYFKMSMEMEDIAQIAADNYPTIARALRKKGLEDEEILRTILALHKNIYTLEDLVDFAVMEKEKGLISKSAKAIRHWKGGKDVRTAMAAHHLGNIENIYKKAVGELSKKDAQTKH